MAQIDIQNQKIGTQIVHYLTLNTYIDAKDAYHQWRMATVIEIIRQSYIKVRFDGWPSKWDQVILTQQEFRITSSKLAPFRKYTDTYTGQKGQARRIFRFQPQKLQQNLKKLTHLQENPSYFSPFQIVQFLRGYHFQYIDSLLTYSFQSINHMNHVICYFKAHIKFMVSYLKKLRQLLPQLYSIQLEYNNIYDNWQTAYASCLPQLIYNTCQIIGDQEKRLKWTKQIQHNQYLRKLKGVIYQMNDGYERINEEIYSRFVKYFLSLNGMGYIFALLNSQFPLPLISFLLKLLRFINPFLQKQQSRKVYSQTYQLLSKRLLNLSQNEFKSIERQDVENIINEFQFICKWQNKSMLQIRIGYMMLKDKVFQKKLKGIIWIKQIAENINKDHKQLIPTLSKWIVSNNVLFQILGDSMHTEIIKRAIQLIEILGRSNSLTIQMLDIIWQSTLDKDQQTIRAIYDLIGEMAASMKKPLLLHIFDKIKKLNFLQHTQLRLNLLKTFSRQAMMTSLNKQTINDYKQENYFGIELMWNFMQDQYGIPYPEACITGLNYMLMIPQCKRIKQYFINRCIQKIKQNKSVYQAIRILLTLSATCKQLPHLANILINSYLAYYESISQFYDQSQQSLDKIYIGKFSHRQNVLKRVQAIEWIGYKQQIEPQMIKKMWINMKGKDWGNWDVQQFMSLLIKQDNVRQGYSLSKILQEQHIHFIFNQILLNHNLTDYISMEYNQFMLFYLIFKKINIAKKKLKDQKYILVSGDDIMGYQNLWNIFYNIKNRRAMEKVTKLIVSLTIRVQQYMIQKIPNRINTLLQKTMNILNRQKPSYILQSKALFLLSTLFAEYQSEYIPLPPDSYIQPFNITVVMHKNQLAKMPKRQELIKNIQQIPNNSKSIKFEIKGNWNERIGNLRNELAQKLGIKPYEVCIQGKRGKFYLAQDNYPFKQSNLGNNITVSYSIDPYSYKIVNRQYNPRALISESLNHLQTLFKLLQSENVQFVREVWNMLKSLPVNEQYKQMVLNGQINIEMFKNVYKGGYILSIMEHMQNPPFLDYLPSLLPIYSSPSSLSFLYSLLSLLLSYENNPLFTPPDDYVQKLINVTIRICEINCDGEDGGARGIQKILKIIQKRKNSKGYGLKELVKNGLIQNQSQQAKHYITGLLSITLKHLHPNYQHQIIHTLFTQLLDVALTFNHSSRTIKFFLALSRQIEHIKDLTISISKLCNKLLLQLKHRKAESKSDGTMAGITYMLASLVKRWPKQTSIVQNQLLFILNQCLFNIPVKNQSNGPLFKFPNTRFSGFKLVQSLMLTNQNNYELTENYLFKFIKQASCRTKKITDWNVNAKNQKSSTGYVGLRNPACICYMNSFFQQIFMIPTFRNCILRVDDPQYYEIPKQQNTLYQIKCLFLALLNSEKPFYDPRPFCNSFKNIEGQPTNVYQQMDVDQFSNMLFDRLQNVIKNTEQKNFIKQHFGGELSNQIISKGCPHSSQNIEPFLSVPVQVKNKKNIMQSLQTMVKGQLLDGDNSYYCEACSKKVTAIKRVCLKSLPKYLILVLKRFQFDYNTMQKQKINNHCQFPMDFSIQEFSQQFLRKKENDNYKSQKIFPPNYFKYKLRGIVIHLGFAESGHYYSYIKDQAENWFEFNDTLIKPFDPADIPLQAFGGQQKTRYSSGKITQLVPGLSLKQKIRNAYLLFYERINDQAHMQIQTQIPPNVDRYCSQFLNYIKEENRKFHIQKFIFSAEFYDFLKQLCHLPTPPIKFLFTAFLTIVIRQKQKKYAFKMAEILSNLLRRKQISKWFIQNISNSKLISQLFLLNPVKEVRRILVWMLNYSVRGEWDRLFIRAVTQVLNVTKGYYNQLFTFLYKILLHSPAYFEEISFAAHAISSFYFQPLPMHSMIELQSCFDPIEMQADQYRYKKQSKDFNQKTWIWIFIRQVFMLKRQGKYKEKDGQQILRGIGNSEISWKVLSQQLQSKSKMKAYGQTMQMLAFQNKVLSQRILSNIAKGIMDKQFKDFRTYFILLKHMLLIEDSLTAFRIQFGMKNVIKSIKENQKYFNQSDIGQQWILKLCRKIPYLNDWMINNSGIWKFMIDWIYGKRCPLPQVIHKNVIQLNQKTHSAKNHHVLHNIKMPSTSKQYQKLSAYKLQKFNTLQKGKSIFQKSEQDSDDDLTLKQIHVDQKVWIQQYILTSREDCVNFVIGKIQSHSNEYICIKLQKQLISVWKDDQYLSLCEPLQVNVQYLSQQNTDFDEQT